MSDSAASPSPADLAGRLRQLWQAGQQPDVASLLAQVGSPNVEQVVALLRVDQVERWRHGAPIAAEEYLRRFPILTADPDKALELIYGEFFLREETGESPSLADFLRRFPSHATRLRQQMHLKDSLTSIPPKQPAAPSSAGSASETLRAPSGPVPPAARTWPTIPGFEIFKELGRGGMGVVYQAWQERLYRLVALKVILAGQHADPLQQARFRVEAEAAGRLHHPNIVQVYDVGDNNGQPYLTMEYVDGGTLHAQLAGQPQPPREAARVVEVLARAVDYAHRRGIVHRDLKPGNILLQRKSEDAALAPAKKPRPSPSESCIFSSEFAPKIADFGLAKLIIGGRRSDHGEVLGTPSYMAPEQVDDEKHDIGPATDIYALGAILYEMLTGRPPFRGNSTLDTLYQVCNDEPIAPTRQQLPVPHDLETICLKCLHKDPGRRYTTAEALAEDLRCFLAGEPIQARPVGWLERLVKWTRRRPALAASFAVSTAAALVLVVQGWWSVHHLHQAAQREAQRRREAEQSFRLALRAVDRMVGEVAEVDWRDVPHTAEKRRRLLLEARDFYRQFLDQRGDDPAVRGEAGRVRVRLGDVQGLLGDARSAAESYRHGIRLLEESVAQQQSAGAVQGEAAAVLVADYTLLATTTLHLKDHTRAATAACQLPRVLPADQAVCLKAAQFLAQCATAAGDDSQLAPQERARRAEEYSGQAVELLRMASSHGFRNAEELKRPMYEPLRRRDDFQNLVRKLDENKP